MIKFAAMLSRMTNTVFMCPFDMKGVAISQMQKTSSALSTVLFEIGVLSFLGLWGTISALTYVYVFVTVLN